MSLITMKPTIRKKGFQSISIDQEDLSAISEIKNTIANILISKPEISDTDENIGILKKISSSYEKIEKNIQLEDDDMILNKHELKEFKVLDSKFHYRYLVYRYKYNIYPKLKKVSAYPPCVQIEPASICNYRCIMCYQADKSFSGKSNGFMGMMSLDLFKKVIDELEGNVEAITFASRGEPTLNKNISEMIKYCNGKFLALKLNTNASLLSENLIHEMLSSDLQTIVFSIDAKDKDEYEKIRVNGKFEKVLRNLENFNNIRNKHYKREDKIVRISGVKINENQDIEEMKKKWGDIADIVAFTNYSPWESSYANEINDIKEPCTELWQRMFIWENGLVNPCDYDYKSKLTKWSVRRQSISSIWNSKEYNLLRDKHLNKKRKEIEPCARCINA